MSIVEWIKSKKNENKNVQQMTERKQNGLELLFF